MPVLLPYVLFCHLVGGCLLTMPVTMHERGSHVTTRSMPAQTGGALAGYCMTDACHPYTHAGWQDFSGWADTAGGIGPGHGVVGFPGHSGSGTGGHVSGGHF